VFDSLTGMAREAPVGGGDQIRWRLADDDGGAPELLGVVERHPGRDELAGLELLHVRAQKILNPVPEAAGLPFRWTVNPYRGCSHACVYCFARPTHVYLGFGMGEDFDRRIVVKVNAVERLRAELRAPRWAGETVAMGTNTDPYQPVEGRYRLTQGIVEALIEARNPFSILTKSTLIGRDADMLGEAARSLDAQAALSIGCLDEEVWRTTEPHTPNPLRRMETVARLNDAGIPTGVMIAPILPGISDRPEMLEAVVAAAIAAGATSVTPILLHLRPGVREHYMAWLRGARPDLVTATERRYRSAYGASAHRHELSAMVAAMVARHGGTRRTGPARFARRRRPAPTGRPERPPDPQLRML
jgi:DNA repair photolyase